MRASKVSDSLHGSAEREMRIERREEKDVEAASAAADKVNKYRKETR